MLPGGQNLSILFEYPKELASERISRKILDRLSMSTIPTISMSDPPQAKLATILTLQEDGLEGDPQIIDSPFKCIEGALSRNNAMWMK